MMFWYPFPGTLQAATTDYIGFVLIKSAIMINVHCVGFSVLQHKLQKKSNKYEDSDFGSLAKNVH